MNSKLIDSPTCERIDKYNCDFLSHGDDISMNERGESFLDNIIKAKRIRYIQSFGGLFSRLLLSLKDKVNTLNDSISENKIIKVHKEMRK